MEIIIQSFISAIQLIRQHMLIVLLIIACLLGIQLINAAVGYRLNILGNYPRSWHGIIGIFISPVLHGSFTHLFFNSIPLFVLGTFVMINGVTNFIMVTLVIMVLSGITICRLFAKISFVLTGYHFLCCRLQVMKRLQE